LETLFRVLAALDWEMVIQAKKDINSLEYKIKENW